VLQANHLPAEGFVRLRDIIGPTGLIPVSRSSWYAGVKDGRFPKPIKLGRRTAAWRVDEIRDLIKRLGSAR
jgi:predicted DNA-binding transcriptional regulator AlpA